MKKVLVLAIALTLTVLSCTNDEEIIDNTLYCIAETKAINKKYDNIVVQIKSKGYWSTNLLMRVEQDRNAEIGRLECD